MGAEGENLGWEEKNGGLNMEFASNDMVKVGRNGHFHRTGSIAPIRAPDGTPKAVVTHWGMGGVIR